MTEEMKVDEEKQNAAIENLQNCNNIYPNSF